MFINYIVSAIIIILLSIHIFFDVIGPGEGRHVWEDACFIMTSSELNKR